MIRVAASRMMLASVLGTVGLSLFAGSACSSTSRTEVKDDDDDGGEAGAPGNVGGADAGGTGGNASTGGAGGSGGANSTNASAGGSAGADSGGSAGTDSGGSGGSLAGGAGGTSTSGGGAGGTSAGGAGGTSAGGAGGTSTSGAGGTSTNTGGAGGTSTDTGGAGGTSTSTGGSDETAPTIVSVSPADESSGVERDVVIEVEFSEAVSEASAAALELTGPDGSVPGSAEVDGAVVSFTPDAKLFLLGEYTLEVGTGVEDLAGNALEDDHSTSFKVRDGEWQPLEHPFGETTARNGYQSAANHVGGLVIGGSDYNDPTRAWAGVFDPTTNDWSSATIVGSDATLDSSVRLAAINDNGQAAVSWWRNSSASPGGWYRYTPDAGFENAGVQASTFNQLTAVNDTGIGMVVTQAGTHQAWFTLQDLESGVVGSVTDFSNSDDDLYGLFAVDSDFVLVHSRVQPDDTHDIVVSRYSTDTNDWASPETVVSFPDQPGRSFAATDELGNLVVVYPEDGDLWARVYSNADDDWSLPTMIAEGATFTLVTMGGGNVVAHYVPADAQLHVAYYQAGTGWIEAGRTAFSLYGGYAGAVDPRGNALTIWSEGTYSRYIPGSGWSEPEVLDLSLNYYTYAAYAFLDGSVAVVTNESITGGQVPVVLRFE